MGCYFNFVMNSFICTECKILVVSLTIPDPISVQAVPHVPYRLQM